MRVVLTAVDGWTLPGTDRAPDRDELRRVGLLEGMPFLVHDDGTYDAELSAFLRHLAVSGAVSPRTWRSYAYDVSAWCDYLREVHGILDWRRATSAELEAYHSLRRLTHGPHQLAPSAWNRALSALHRLYAWAVEAGHVTATTNPVRTVTSVVSALYGQPIRPERRAMKATVVESAPVRALSSAQYRFFRDVGLRGQLPNGERDPTFRGREGERNATFADLLARTGLRVAEGSALVLWDVPGLSEEAVTLQREVKFTLPSAIAKGRKSRDVHLPRTSIVALRDYIAVERQARIDQATEDGAYAGVARPIMARAGREGHYVPFRGKPLSLDRCPRSTRSRLITHDAAGRPVAPVWLWLARDGRPMSGEDAWNKVFRAASERCTAHGIPLDVSPHDMRHTFAVHFLSALIRETVGRAKANVEDALRSPGTVLYQRVIGDPLRILQRRLGHASIQTTHRYLHYLPEVADVESDALLELDASLSAGDIARGRE